MARPATFRATAKAEREPQGGTWDEDSKMKSPYPTPSTSPTASITPGVRSLALGAAETHNAKPWWKSPSLSVNWTVLSRFALGFWIIIIAVVAYDSLPSFPFHLSPELPSLRRALNPFAPATDDHVTKCTQPPELVPTKHKVLWDDLMAKLDTPAFKREIIESLQGAIRIPTESFDNTPPPSDVLHPAYAPFPTFRAYLRARFPLIHGTTSSPSATPEALPPPSPINLTLVNHHALLYTWPGHTASTRPLLLCAHQDVVPVPPSTLPLWTHPPYSGFTSLHSSSSHSSSSHCSHSSYSSPHSASAQTRIWGRGATDDKSQLTAILTAVEALLHSGFTPKRNLVLAFGFDEEASGFHGARELSVELERRWGEEGVGMVVDEGAGFYDLFGGGREVSAVTARAAGREGEGEGQSELGDEAEAEYHEEEDEEQKPDETEDEKGITLAIPGISEKGNYNIRIDVTGPGGHSSFPPAHTTIGLLAEALVVLESEGFEMRVTTQHPVYPLAQCLVRSAPLPLPSLPHIPLLSPLLRPLSPLLTPILRPLFHTLSTHTLRPLLSHLLRLAPTRALLLSLPQVKNNPLVRSLVPTTQAVDVVRGGEKSNALPEGAWGVVNHRVGVGSRLGDVQERYERVLKPFAEKHGLTYVAWNKTVYQPPSPPSPYKLTIHNATAHGVEPAPLTPTSPRDGPWTLLAGTIRATYRVHRERAWRGSRLPSSSVEGQENTVKPQAKATEVNDEKVNDEKVNDKKKNTKEKKIRDILVAPGMMSGNTDTRYYWRLSRHIFRYNHHYGGTRPDPGRNGIHTVDEWIDADVLIESVRFFVTLILNADEGDFLDT